MTQFRTRRDGQKFPIGGSKGGGMDAAKMADAKKAFNQRVVEEAKKLDSTDNRLAVTKDGKIRDGAVSSLKGADDQKQDSKQIIKTESDMVKEIDKVEHEKHPRPWEVKRAMADVKNLSVVHPELADKVVESKQRSRRQ